MTVPLYYRLCFAFVVLVGVISGTLFGLSLAGYVLDPVSGLFCIFGTGVLVATLIVAGKQARGNALPEGDTK